MLRKFAAFVLTPIAFAFLGVIQNVPGEAQFLWFMGYITGAALISIDFGDNHK